MTPRQNLAAAVRPFGPGGKLLAEHIPAFDALADALGLPRDDEVRPKLGKLSEQFESGGRGPGTVSSGYGDPGGGGLFGAAATPFQNGATAVLGGGLDVVPRYERDRGDTVLMGQINAPNANVTLAQLLPGYRPGMRLFIPGGVITGDGQIIADAPGVLNLNCIRFPSGA